LLRLFNFRHSTLSIHHNNQATVASVGSVASAAPVAQQVSAKSKTPTITESDVASAPAVNADADADANEAADFATADGEDNAASFIQVSG
jgi:hypothetical protein